MKLSQYGYTMVEVLLFLAISTALFASVASIISGQQTRTEFTRSVRDVETAIQDAINDVDAGYFPESATNPPGCSGASGQGTRANCIFAGKAIQFGANSNPNNYNIYTIAGDRVTPGINGKEVKDIGEAMPRIITTAAYTEEKSLYPNLRFTRIIVGGVDSAAFAILPSFGKTQNPVEASVVNNSGSAVLATVPGVPLPATNAQMNGPVAAMAATNITNAASGIVICVKDVDANRRAVISFGGNRGGAIESKFETADLAAAGCPA